MLLPAITHSKFKSSRKGTFLLRGTKSIWSQSEKIRFLFVGGYNTLFGYVTFAAAYWLLHDEIHYVGLAIAAHLIAVTNSFLTQKYLVFRSKGSWRHEFLRFQIGYLAVLPIGVGLLVFFYEIVGLHMMVAQGVSLFVGVVASYVVNRYFTFPGR